MGTAVLNPQDYLTAPQRDQTCEFLRVAECPSPVARPNGRVFPAVYEASIPGTHQRGRDVALRNKIPSQDRCLLSRKDSSAGLLPIPDRALQAARNSYHTLGPRISASGFREIVDAYDIKHSVPSHHSSYASQVYISRRPSVPMLDHAARSQKLLYEHFPLHGVQPHERRLLCRDACLPPNLAQGMLSCAGGTESLCQKPKILANSHFDDVLNSVWLKRADSFDQSVHYRKRLHPELSRVEFCLGRQCAKPSFKVLPDGQGKFICTKTRITGRKFNVYKQLKRSVSEKVQERLETPNLRRPAPKEDGEMLATCLPKGVVRSHVAKNGNSKVEVKLTSSATPSPSIGRKKEKGPQMRLSLDVATVGMGRSCRAPISQQMVGASLHGKCSGSLDAAVGHKGLNVAGYKDVNEKDIMAGTAGFAPQVEDGLCEVNVTSTFDNQPAGSNIRSSKSVIGSEGEQRGEGSVSDNDEMWVSMMNDERWAGPSFFNSPSPSSLPVPSFTFLFSRAPSAGSKPTNAAIYGAHMVSDKPSLQASCAWDVTVATKDLRRMLHLDNATFDI